MKKLATKSETADAPTREAGEGVAAVERALSIVAALETSDQPMTLAEIAVCTGFYKSTILRLLGSLIGTGYVTHLPDRSYDLGPMAFRLGVAFTRKNAIGHHVMPALQELVDRGTESASLPRAAGCRQSRLPVQGEFASRDAGSRRGRSQLRVVAWRCRANHLGLRRSHRSTLTTPFVPKVSTSRRASAIELRRGSRTRVRSTRHAGRRDLAVGAARAIRQD